LSSPPSSSKDEVDVSVEELEVAVEVSDALAVLVLAVLVLAVLAEDVGEFDDVEVSRELEEVFEAFEVFEALEAFDVLALSLETLDLSFEEVGSEGGA
jgi:hypothetical protein